MILHTVCHDVTTNFTSLESQSEISTVEVNIDVSHVVQEAQKLSKQFISDPSITVCVKPHSA